MTCTPTFVHACDAIRLQIRYVALPSLSWHARSIPVRSPLEQYATHGSTILRRPLGVLSPAPPCRSSIRHEFEKAGSAPAISLAGVIDCGKLSWIITIIHDAAPDYPAG